MSSDEQSGQGFEPEPPPPLDMEAEPYSTPVISENWTILPTPGEVITSFTGNSYTMGEQIGEGAFGVVFACTDRWNNELAAKVMKSRGTYDTLKQTTEAELQKLILLRHPHITYLYDAFEYRNTFYLITERCYCPLADLFSRVPNFIGLAWIRAIARCLLQAVHYIHASGYCHQDIHLGNAFFSFARDEMIREDPGSIQFKLGDLGVARLFSEVDANNTRALWMLPPEVLNPVEFGPIDHRQDIYHCGLLFLHLAHGKELRFSQEEILAGLPRSLALQLPQPFNFAIEKALRRHVAYRTESALEFWRDLNSPEAENNAPASEDGTLPFGPPETSEET